MLSMGVCRPVKNKETSQNRAERRKGPLVDILFMLLLCAVNALWFWPLSSRGIIKGDDIGYVLAGRGIKTFHDLFAFDGYKYRPVVSLLEMLETRLCGSSYGAYFAVNLAMQCVVTALLYRLALRISRRRIIALCAGLLFIMCPFLYYNVTQVFGMMEAVCVLLLLFIIENGLRFFKTGHVRWLIVLLLFNKCNNFSICFNDIIVF